MTLKKFGPYSLSQLDEAAAFVIGLSENRPIVCFSGEPGAGKTTLIKEICSQLGVVDITSSPTFSLVNEYVASKGGIIYHMDAYRLNSANEALDFGAEEYLDGSHRCFIEWPEVLGPLLPVNAIHFTIDSDEGQRTIQVKD